MWYVVIKRDKEQLWPKWYVSLLSSINHNVVMPWSWCLHQWSVPYWHKRGGDVYVTKVSLCTSWFFQFFSCHTNQEFFFVQERLILSQNKVRALYFVLGYISHGVFLQACIGIGMCPCRTTKLQVVLYITLTVNSSLTFWSTKILPKQLSTNVTRTQIDSTISEWKQNKNQWQCGDQKVNLGNCKKTMSRSWFV